MNLNSPSRSLAIPVMNYLNQPGQLVRNYKYARIPLLGKSKDLSLYPPSLDRHYLNLVMSNVKNLATKNPSNMIMLDNHLNRIPNSIEFVYVERPFTRDDKQ